MIEEKNESRMGGVQKDLRVLSSSSQGKPEAWLLCFVKEGKWIRLGGNSGKALKANS